MSDPAERFFAAATATLSENAELQCMARRELEECLEAGESEGLSDATDRLEAAKPKRTWKIVLYAVTAAVSLVSLGVLERMVASFDGFRVFLDPLAGHFPDPVKTETRWGRNLSSQQRLLLFGDTAKSGPAAQFKALWDSDPTNPAYFAEYSLQFISEHGKLPPDFLETADRLDPDNAWFTLIAASMTAKNAVKKSTQSSLEREQGLPPSYEILEPKRLDESIQFLEKAASQPRFESYQASLLAQRIALLPPRSDYTSQWPGIVHLAMRPLASIHFRHAADAADAAAWQAADRGDAGAFRKIAANWESCLRKIAGEETPELLQGLVARVTLQGSANRYGKTSLPGIEDWNDRWRRISERMLAEKEERDRRESPDALKLRSGMMSGLSLPLLWKQLRSPIPISDAELKPGRMVDHELFSRISAAILWQLFGLMLLAAALYRQRAGLLVRRISARLEQVLRPIDWAWILGGGVLAPFLFYLAIYRLSPLGARDWSLSASAFLVPSGQIAAMGFLMIVLPVLIAGRKLGRRGAMLGWEKDHAWLGWSAVACGALSLPVTGLSFASGKGSEITMTIAALLLGVLALGWLAIGIRAVFSKRPALLRRATLSRILVPAYALAMLFMVASMPLYHAAEKHWLAQDRLTEISPDAPALSRYEWQVARALRAELLEVLDSK